jgi:hypothetical protein
VTICFERSAVTGGLHIRVLKIPGTIESIEPNYNGQLEMPTEGALLMSHMAGKEPISIDFHHRDNSRHLADDFDQKMLGGFKYIQFISILIFHH